MNYDASNKTSMFALAYVLDNKPYAFKPTIAAELIVNKLMNVDLSLMWIMKISQFIYRDKNNLVRWVSMFNKFPNLTHNLIAGTIDHIENSGFNQDEVNRLANILNRYS